jgi:hypothetical protein
MGPKYLKEVLQTIGTCFLSAHKELHTVLLMIMACSISSKEEEKMEPVIPEQKVNKDDSRSTFRIPSYGKNKELERREVHLQ